jgi:hypothetical protein
VKKPYDKVDWIGLVAYILCGKALALLEDYIVGSCGEK